MEVELKEECTRMVSIPGLTSTWIIKSKEVQEVEGDTFVRAPCSHNYSLLHLVCDDNAGVPWARVDASKITMTSCMAAGDAAQDEEWCTS